MGESRVESRLQPCLLDRLTDHAPEQGDEPRQSRVISLNQLRGLVMRDLAWLLNTTNIECVHDLDAYPHVRTSVLNYGLPDLTGVSASSLRSQELERDVRDAIRRFEPRVLDKDLRVTVVSRDEANPNALTFEIIGEVWAEPIPERLFLRTMVDLETGSVEISSGG